MEDEGIKVTGTTTKGPTGGATTGAPPPVTTAKSLPSPMVTSPIRRGWGRWDLILKIGLIPDFTNVTNELGRLFIIHSLLR